MGDRLLYFMLKPPRPVLPIIVGQRRAVGLPGGYGADRLHITLAFIGSLAVPGVDIIPILSAVGASIHAEPFRVVFDRIEGNVLKGSEPIRGLIAFQRLLVQTLAAHRVPVASGRFAPHISLAYGIPAKPGIAIDPISWTVDDFLLVESRHGEGRHVEHGRWRLGRL